MFSTPRVVSMTLCQHCPVLVFLLVVSAKQRHSASSGSSKGANWAKAGSQHAAGAVQSSPSYVVLGAGTRCLPLPRTMMLWL
jgi:hypothetical protein